MRIVMIYGPYAGELGIVERRVARAAVEAYEVRLIERAIHIITVPWHFQEIDRETAA